MVVGPRIKVKTEFMDTHGVKAVQEVVEEAVQLKIEYLHFMLFQQKTGADPKRKLAF